MLGYNNNSNNRLIQIIQLGIAYMAKIHIRLQKDVITNTSSDILKQ